MVAVDYEAAWDELQEHILTRDGHGSKSLLAVMADLRVRHRITEPDTSRALRLAAAAASDIARATPAPVAHAGGPPQGPKEDHDGKQHHHSRQVA